MCFLTDDEASSNIHMRPPPSLYNSLPIVAIDADTRVDTMSITHMVYAMDKKEKVLALCGETKVDNKASSWVTMIQVFEYYNSHHLKKAFEAAFGCVTCLPGCFTMYRIIADDGTPLLPGDGVLYEYSRNDIETLHGMWMFAYSLLHLHYRSGSHNSPYLLSSYFIFREKPLSLGRG